MGIKHEVAYLLASYVDVVSGCTTEPIGQLLKELFSTPYFRCSVVEDACTVECCGALKV